MNKVVSITKAAAATENFIKERFVSELMTLLTSGSFTGCSLQSCDVSAQKIQFELSYDTQCYTSYANSSSPKSLEGNEEVLCQPVTERHIEYVPTELHVHTILCQSFHITWEMPLAKQQTTMKCQVKVIPIRSLLDQSFNSKVDVQPAICRYHFVRIIS